MAKCTINAAANVAADSDTYVECEGSTIPSCSPAGESGGFVVRVWGIDKKGQQVNSLFSFCTLKIARCAVARGLVELGPRAHFCMHQWRKKRVTAAGKSRGFAHNPPGRAYAAHLFILRGINHGNTKTHHQHQRQQPSIC